MRPDRAKLIQQVVRHIPLIGWARTYQRAWLRDDLVSGQEDLS